MTFKQWTLFIALTLIWGASFLWIKIAVREVGPLTVVALRLVFALLALAPIMMRKRPGMPRTLRRWLQVFILAATSSTVPWLLITWAEQYIDSAVATVLNATVPMFTIVTAHFALSDDRMTPGRMAGLLVGFSGVVVLVARNLQLGASDDNAHMRLLGQGAMLLSSCLYGVSNVYARAKFRNTAPVYQAFYTMLVGGAVMWVVTPSIESPFVLPVLPITWVAIAWLGMLGAGISYLLFYILLHEIGPTRISTVTYTIPAIGVTLGVVFLGEALTWQLVVGTLLIVSGVAWVTRRHG